MKHSIAVLCGTPRGECRGSYVKLNHQMPDGTKAHGSHEQAFGCHAAWLIRRGYVRSGSRSFDAPDGGPTITLTKKMRFGARLRAGKEGRYMPRGGRGGVIVSC